MRILHILHNFSNIKFSEDLFETFSDNVKYLFSYFDDFIHLIKH